MKTTCNHGKNRRKWLLETGPRRVHHAPMTGSAAIECRNLYKIEMTGNLGGKLDLRSEAMPIIVEPVKRLLGRMEK